MRYVSEDAYALFPTVRNDVIEGYLGGGLPIIAATDIPVEISDLTDAKGLLID